MFEMILLVAVVISLVLMFGAIYFHSKKKHNVKKERKIHVGKTLEVSTFSGETKKRIKEERSKR